MDDVGELARRRADAVGDEVGRADAVAERRRDGAGQRLPRARLVRGPRRASAPPRAAATTGWRRPGRRSRRRGRGTAANTLGPWPASQRGGDDAAVGLVAGRDLGQRGPVARVGEHDVELAGLEPRAPAASSSGRVRSTVDARMPLGAGRPVEAVAHGDRDPGAAATRRRRTRARAVQLAGVVVERVDDEQVAALAVADADGRGPQVELLLQQPSSAGSRRLAISTASAPSTALARDGAARRRRSTAMRLGAERDVHLVRARTRAAAPPARACASPRRSAPGPRRGRRGTRRCACGRSLGRLQREHVVERDGLALVGELLEAAERRVELRRRRARRPPRRTPARTRGAPSACRAAASSRSPSSVGSMIWYVALSFSIPSWWMPASWANALAPTTALFALHRVAGEPRDEPRRGADAAAGRSPSRRRSGRGARGGRRRSPRAPRCRPARRGR